MTTAIAPSAYPVAVAERGVPHAQRLPQAVVPGVAPEALGRGGLVAPGVGLGRQALQGAGPHQLQAQVHDPLVGGTGEGHAKDVDVGIARDAAGRGFSVCLAEMGDLASGTSSAATKLIHGGLRYLEQYEFRLVRESLLERETLWRNAPHIIWPLRFVLPHHSGLRPRWLLRLGLFLYDRLGSRKILPSSKSVK